MLEMPSGTGKTVSLLALIVAYQRVSGSQGILRDLGGSPGVWGGSGGIQRVWRGFGGSWRVLRGSGGSRRLHEAEICWFLGDPNGSREISRGLGRVLEDPDGFWGILMDPGGS